MEGSSQNGGSAATEGPVYPCCLPLFLGSTTMIFSLPLVLESKAGQGSEFTCLSNREVHTGTLYDSDAFLLQRAKMAQVSVTFLLKVK